MKNFRCVERMKLNGESVKSLFDVDVAKKKCGCSIIAGTLVSIQSPTECVKITVGETMRSIHSHLFLSILGILHCNDRTVLYQSVKRASIVCRK